MEAHELSVVSRHLKLSLNYVLKLKSVAENPVYSCIFEPKNVKLFQESLYFGKFHLSASIFYHTRKNLKLI